MLRDRLVSAAAALLLCTLAAGRVAAAGAPDDDRVGNLEERVAELEKKMEEPREAAPEGPAYRTAPSFGFGDVMNPDLSAVVSTVGEWSDDKENDARNKIRLEHAELAFQGYLYPGIRADVIGAFGQHYEGDTVETHMHLEEAFATIATLPWGLDRHFTIQVGRKLQDFGKFNAIHPHHWPFADRPLIHAHFFGDHNWFDDGGQVEFLVPTEKIGLEGLYLTFTSGYWNGRALELDTGATPPDFGA
ncbi:MAG: hypothetical protein JXP34_22430, partial [Planctomycetes bacterium]|nr:hypothetical protein [Planctomycetota bacterium]